MNITTDGRMLDSQDASSIFQPDGPVVADTSVKPKPQHVDIRVVQNETIPRLEELAKELESSHSEG